MDTLLEAVKIKDEGKATDWRKSEEWATVEEMIKMQGKVVFHVCFAQVPTFFVCLFLGM